MFKIGFAAHSDDKPIEAESVAANSVTTTPKKSVVRIHFPARNITLSYYNDAFDLKRGDIVYVDGKLEGLRGHVVDITYNFRIKLSDYKRVISVADTNIKGEFHFAGSHFVTFGRTALPYEKIITWFKAPENEDEIYVSGNDETSFCLEDLSTMKISSSIADRGHEYYIENKVSYLCLDGSCGRAIVEGSQAYELEFEYQKGEVRSLTCNCFCSYPCKHEFAAMLQLKEALDMIEKNYSKQYEETEYFASVSKDTLLNFAVDGKEQGSIVL
ncbi:MAG: SWIM zinc finger family protein [Candidatus Heteroscillospira sp.]|jgi:hypothetical protein